MCGHGNFPSPQKCLLERRQWVQKAAELHKPPWVSKAATRLGSLDWVCFTGLRPVCLWEPGAELLGTDLGTANPSAHGQGL